MNDRMCTKSALMLVAGAVSILTLTAGSASAQTTHDVIVAPAGSLTFSPASLTIEVGDTVSWLWENGGHNVGSGLPGAPTPFFLSGPPAPAGTTFSVLFDQAFLDANSVFDNFYDYHCHPHGDFGMVGSIRVIPAPGAAALGALGFGILGVRRSR